MCYILIGFLAILLYVFIGALMAHIFNEGKEVDTFMIGWALILLGFIVIELFNFINNLSEKIAKVINNIINTIRSSKEKKRKPKFTYNNSEMQNFHEWVVSSSKEMYPKNKKKQEAYKTGIYALLDKINFDYNEERKTK